MTYSMRQIPEFIEKKTQTFG